MSNSVAPALYRQRRLVGERETQSTRERGRDSVSEDILKTSDGQDALAPFKEPVRICGPHPLLGLRIQRAELQAEEAKQQPGFPLLASFLASFLTPLLTPFLERLLPKLPVPTVDLLCQHGI